MSKLSSTGISSEVVMSPGPSIADSGVAVGADSPPPPEETFFTAVGSGVGTAVGAGVEVAVGSGEGSFAAVTPDGDSGVGVGAGTGVAVAGTGTSLLLTTTGSSRVASLLGASHPFIGYRPFSSVRDRGGF